MNRQNQILVGILVLQLAIVAFIFWPGRNATASAEALYAGTSIDNIQSITVSDQDKSVKVSRSGDGWVLPEADDFPVTALQVSDAISKVLTIDMRRLVASNATSHSRLQVTDDTFARRVDLETKDGQTLALYVGSSPSARATNVRRGDSTNVYLTGSVSAADLHTDVANWIDTAYLALPETEIQGLTIENAQGKLTFTRPTTTTWTLADLVAGETFNQNNLTSALTRLSGFNMVRPLGKEAKPEYGMDAPAATIIIQSQPAGGAAKTTTLMIGKQLPDSQNYVAKSSDSEYYVEAASFGVEDFINRGRAEYLQAPEPAATTPLTGTNFITGFEGITATTPLSTSTPVTASEDAITATTPVTASEVVTPAQ